MEEIIKNLVKELTEYSVAYYSGNEIVSNDVYDAKEAQLREIDPYNDFFSKIVDTAGKSTFNKITHKNQMLSLGKAYTIEEMLNWGKPVKGISMTKMDGCAISLEYQLSDDFFILKTGSTRGDEGKIGEDITENLKQICDIPTCINKNKILGDIIEFEVRGEVYMKKSVFNKLSANDDQIKNIRNIAPGSLRQKDISITKNRSLNFYAYNIIGFNNIKTMESKLKLLDDIGFKVVDYEIINNLNDKLELEASFEYFIEKRKEYDYEIDGVVYYIDDISIFNELGSTSHHPKGAIAWKFENECGETIYKETQWQVSRTGLVNPVGIFEVVKIGNSNITNATLHNISIIKNLGIGVGDKILVSKRGGVIPKIEKVIEHKDTPIIIIKECPACNQPLEIHTSDDGIETLHCVNIDCPAQILTKIVHFVTVLEIMDIGESTIENMIDMSLINDPSDLYILNKEMILKLNNVKNKKAEKIVKSIQSSRNVTLDKFLTSLGIKGLGSSMSEAVSNHFKKMNNVIDAKKEDLLNINGVGDVLAENIVNGLVSKKELISKLLKYITIAEEEKPSGKLSGLSFIITGTLSISRSEFEKTIKINGGEIKSSVSKSLSYLIVGENPGDKLEKAKKFGIKIVNENDIFNMIN